MASFAQVFGHVTVLPATGEGTVEAHEGTVKRHKADSACRRLQLSIREGGSFVSGALEFDEE